MCYNRITPVITLSEVKNMNVKIGAIIKRLRTEKHITQDTLATAMGVTPQAISRWESEGGYPDIELLPALADFFSVSIDELLGYRSSEREQELARIKQELDRLAEVGTVDQRIAYARNAFARYPNDYEIRDHLAVALYFSWEETRDEVLFGEIEGLLKTIVEECRDEDTRYDAIGTLIILYKETGQSDKVSELIRLLTPMKYCREFTLSWGIGDGNTEIYIQDEIDKLTDCLGTAISSYVLSEDLPNDPSTWDKKIQMLTLSNRLYEMIYGDNLMFYHVRLSRNYWLISTYQISQGKISDTLGSLERMCDHAVKYDMSFAADHGKHYTSILTDKLIYPEPGKDFHELTEHTNCYYMLDRLAHPRYDGIREEPRFVAVVERLRQYAT